MAFDYFVQEKVDIAIIETGLGGRLDSTNIISPELSIITNIGYDHMALLGNTLEAIASEKAGIIKLDTPVVIGVTDPATKKVFEDKANKENAPIYFAEDFIEFKSFQNNWQNALFEFNQPLIHLLDAPLFPKTLPSPATFQQNTKLKFKSNIGGNAITFNDGLEAYSE